MPQISLSSHPSDDIVISKIWWLKIPVGEAEQTIRWSASIGHFVFPSRQPNLVVLIANEASHIDVTIVDDHDRFSLLEPLHLLLEMDLVGVRLPLRHLLGLCLLSKLLRDQLTVLWTLETTLLDARSLAAPKRR